MRSERGWISKRQCFSAQAFMGLLVSPLLCARQFPARGLDRGPPPSLDRRQTVQRRKTACHIQKRPCLARPQTERPGAARREQRRAESESSLRQSRDCQSHIEALCVCRQQSPGASHDRALRKSTALARSFRTQSRASDHRSAAPQQCLHRALVPYFRVFDGPRRTTVRMKS